MNNNYPIILAHGIARFDFLRDSLWQRIRDWMPDDLPIWDKTHYFKGVASHLQENGFTVHQTSVEFAADVSVRARQLAIQINLILDSSSHKKVHIIGHSMGGLDARHMIVRENMADKVASLSTIGTPHLGTSFADYAFDNDVDGIVEILREIIDFDGFLNLTPNAADSFNEYARNAEATNNVIYHTYAGHQERKLIFSPLQYPWQIIYDAEGDNDGLVSVTSQQWASELVADNGTQKEIHQHSFPIPVDHLNEIGWWDWNELKDAPWWQLNIFKAKREYEASVRDVYLEMVLNVSQ